MPFNFSLVALINNAAPTDEWSIPIVFIGVPDPQVNWELHIHKHFKTGMLIVLD